MLARHPPRAATHLISRCYHKTVLSEATVYSRDTNHEPHAHTRSLQREDEGGKRGQGIEPASPLVILSPSLSLKVLCLFVPSPLVVRTGGHRDPRGKSTETKHQTKKREQRGGENKQELQREDFFKRGKGEFFGTDVLFRVQKKVSPIPFFFSLMVVCLCTVGVEMGVRRELLRRVGKRAVRAVRTRAAILDVHAHLCLDFGAVNAATLALRATEATAHLLLHHVLRRQLPVRRARVVVNEVHFVVRGVGHLPARRQLRYGGHLRVGTRVGVVASSVGVHLHDCVKGGGRRKNEKDSK